MNGPGVITEPARIQALWEAHCAGRTDLTPFQHPVFLDGLTRSVPWTPALIEWNDQLTQWAFLRRRGPSTDLILPPFCPFSALLFSPSSSASGRTDAFGRLGAGMPGIPASRLFSVDPQDWAAAGRPAAPVGLTGQEKATWVVNLAPIEELMDAWSASARRTWRKHLGEYRFSEGGSTADLIALVEAGYARHGRRLPLSASALQSWSRSLMHAGLGTLYTLAEGSKLAAGILVLRGPVRAFYWLAGSLPGPAMTVLLGHVFEHLHQQGVPSFDFMGANTPGISEFKRRFGGARVIYPHWVRRTTVSSLLERAARIRRGWRR